MDKHSLQAQIDALTRLHGAAECEIGVLTRFDIPELAQLSLAAYGERQTLEAQAEATDEMRLCFEGVFGTPYCNGFGRRMRTPMPRLGSFIPDRPHR